MRRTVLGLVLLAPLALGTASARAHGIGDDAAGRTVLEYVPFGAEHMLLGWDHLLFVFGVVLLAGSALQAAKLISLFVAGHSLTLIVASLAGWTVNATAVDIVIAASVVFVGVVGLRGRPESWRWFGGAVFAFGLVHGLGLATRLQDAGLPDEGIIWKVLAFNLGVEIGQVLAVGAVVTIGWLLTRQSRKAMDDIRRIAFALVVAGGLVGIGLLTLPGPGDEEDGAAVIAAAGCVEEPSEAPPFDPSAGHPSQDFYEPGDEVDAVDLFHVANDGFAIVKYREDISVADLAALREWHATAPSEFIIVAPDEDQEDELYAFTREASLACGEFELDAVTEFTQTWFSQLGTT